MGESVFYNTCGTLIRLRIIPLKVDQSLTGIIRTYIIISVSQFGICLVSSARTLVVIKFEGHRTSENVCVSAIACS